MKFYSFNLQIGNSNIDVSEQEVAAQLFPANDDEGQEIPTLIKFPGLVIEDEDWEIKFSVRDLHRWKEQGCPWEISGCYVKSKKREEVSQKTIEMAITGTCNEKPKVVNWTLTKTVHGDFEIRGFYYGSSSRWNDTIELCRMLDSDLEDNVLFMHNSVCVNNGNLCSTAAGGALACEQSTTPSTTPSTTDHIYVADFAGHITRGTWNPITKGDKVHEKGMVKSDWKCHLCAYNDGTTTTMFKIVNDKKWKLCCHQCIDMLEYIFCKDTFTVVKKYWAKTQNF